MAYATTRPGMSRNSPMANERQGCRNKPGGRVVVKIVQWSDLCSILLAHGTRNSAPVSEGPQYRPQPVSSTPEQLRHFKNPRTPSHVHACNNVGVVKVSRADTGHRGDRRNETWHFCLSWLCYPANPLLLFFSVALTHMYKHTPDHAQHGNHIFPQPFHFFAHFCVKKP